VGPLHHTTAALAAELLQRTCAAFETALCGSRNVCIAARSLQLAFVGLASRCCKSMPGSAPLLWKWQRHTALFEPLHLTTPTQPFSPFHPCRLAPLPASKLNKLKADVEAVQELLAQGK